MRRVDTRPPGPRPFFEQDDGVTLAAERLRAGQARHSRPDASDPHEYPRAGVQQTNLLHAGHLQTPGLSIGADHA